MVLSNIQYSFAASATGVSSLCVSRWQKKIQIKKNNNNKEKTMIIKLANLSMQKPSDSIFCL